MHQNRPNPFRRSTSIGYALPRGGRVSLEVYDLSGRRVASLLDGWRPAGEHSVEWDQRDRAGSLVRAGVYLYRLRAGDAGTIERKLVVLP
jgi:flagellar hook assembly protein FlgD